MRNIQDILHVASHAIEQALTGSHLNKNKEKELVLEITLPSKHTAYQLPEFGMPCLEKIPTNRWYRKI